METTAIRLRKRRSQLGITKSMLAEKANVSHSTISRLEAGEYLYSRHLFNIADVLGVNVDWLVRGRFPVRRYSSVDEEKC